MSNAALVGLFPQRAAECQLLKAPDSVQCSRASSTLHRKRTHKEGLWQSLRLKLWVSIILVTYGFNNRQKVSQEWKCPNNYKCFHTEMQVSVTVY